MLIFYKQVSIDDGFEVLDKTKHNRLVGGREVSQCSGWHLFKSLQGKPIKCWSCGCEADRWIVDHGRNNHVGRPVLNLYGFHNGRVVLINRDHIIPKSLGGVDDLENLRPACSDCNEARGNVINEEELQFRIDNPHLISQARLEAGRANARRFLERDGNIEEKTRTILAWSAIGEIL